MKICSPITFIIMATLFFLSGCANLMPPPEIPVNSESVAAGGVVTRSGTPQQLVGDPVAVGSRLPDVTVTTRNLQTSSLHSLKGKVTVLSIVPSLDTQVCERQTHLLGEADAEELPADIVRATISRDLPFAQNRFADETGFEQIYYLSDYKDAAFGRGTGLLIEEIGLLARGVMVVDRDGIIRYMQVVPEVTHLPDMEKAFAAAREVAGEN